MTDLTRTQYFNPEKENISKTAQVLEDVFHIMAEKGYNPINQMVGYIMSGDPTYITGHKNARSMIMRVERDELVEEVFRYYAKAHGWDAR